MHTDSNNRPTKRFSATYFWDDARWWIELTAYDFEDAEARCKHLNLRLRGLHVMDIPCAPASAPAVGLGVRVFTAVANFFRKR